MAKSRNWAADNRITAFLLKGQHQPADPGRPGQRVPVRRGKAGPQSFGQKRPVTVPDPACQVKIATLIAVKRCQDGFQRHKAKPDNVARHRITRGEAVEQHRCQRCSPDHRTGGR